MVSCMDSRPLYVYGIPVPGHVVHSVQEMVSRAPKDLEIVLRRRIEKDSPLDWPFSKEKAATATLAVSIFKRPPHCIETALSLDSAV